MRFNLFLKTAVFAAVAVSGFHVAASAQRPRQNFTRPQTFDVQHYIVRSKFDRTKRQVIGDTTVQLKPLRAGFREVMLDATEMKFDSVALEQGVPLKYRTAGEKIYISLDRTYTTDDLVSIRLKYVATPTKGVYFVNEVRDGREILSPAQIWTQGEADETHHWIPSFDFPSDKSTTEQFLTANRDETVISNGQFIGKTENADGTATWHYKMSDPHPLYLLSFVIGKYAKASDDYNGVPLGYYVYPGREEVVPRAFGRTKEMMAVFEKLTGVKYPFNKYDQTIVASFHFGGMENITATTLSDTEVFAAGISEVGSGTEDLISHELAHSWFGNLVTCKNWAELWLNEGFATLMEAAFREKKYGRANYMVKILTDAQAFLVDDAVNRKRHGLFNQNAGNVDSLFERAATTYNKGGVVLHTLREEIGDEAFWKAVNIYLTRYRFGSVESTDLQRVMEEASGRKLDWFFAQWVYGAGHPKLNIRQNYNAATKRLMLTVNQIQKIDGITPQAFRLPLEIEITTDAGEKVEKIVVGKRSETFNFNLDGIPTGVKIDDSDKIPLKTVKLAPISISR
ncbi:MAG: M1 family metallopeptidase [Acidobacteria bacterium]|nr:M1 family metallopeptidase [Acidobacteriota bacterium]